MNRKEQQGTIKRHPDGFGFFIPDNPELPDVYIPRHSMRGIMTNDKVMVKVERERGSDRFRGEISKVLERNTRVLVGKFQQEKNRNLIKDESKAWGEDLVIAAQDIAGAKNGDLVSVEILSYPDDKRGFWGKVKEVLGHHQDPMTDIKRVLIGNHIPHEFSKKTLAEVGKYSEHVSEKDFKGRKDLRNLNLITIDGATAKDFDDAIYVQKEPRGFRLYVAIADVSHYVRPGMSVDLEAYERGTSVYFPNFVVPMLPEILSNELCSLKPHVPRLSLVAEMQIDHSGVIQNSVFYEAVIESKARVTYGEAQEVIEGSRVEKLDHVAADILLAADLAKILMKKRFSEGSLDLEIPEIQVVVDSTGMPTDLIKSERLFAHRLIEEMMLLANIAVAQFLDSKEIPSVYRIHEPPKEEAIKLLERYLTSFGSKARLAGSQLQKKLTAALQEFEGKTQAQILNILTLRSMNQAKYSIDNVGHFGLGFEHYTHFTSPIRRYPDLIVHRLIKSQIMKSNHYRTIEENDLSSAAIMLSACEQRSVKAERQFVAIKKARFMHRHLGKEFDGVISSITKFGMFVLLRNFEVDGLVHIDSLHELRLEFDEDRLCLHNRKTGFQFNIGDLITIQVMAADPEQGQIDFKFIKKIESGGFELKAKFDPETHFRSAAAKWRERNFGSQFKKEPERPERRSGSERRRNSDKPASEGSPSRESGLEFKPRDKKGNFSSEKRNKPVFKRRKKGPKSGFKKSKRR